MNKSVESFRETFRQLAVFELDPKEYLRTNTDSGNLTYLLKAADVADDIFWRQALPDMDYESLFERIGDDEELKEIFLLHHGPYDRLNNDAPFLLVEPKPSGAGFYPRDLSREEFIDHIGKYRDSEPDLESPYTVIRRANSHLAAIPYHEAYRNLVERLSNLLYEASATERHPLFREFLAQRAQDLLTDEYYASDSLWVRLVDNPIDLVIGPYEVYEDRLMGLKASYRTIVLERDFEESDKIRRLQRELLSLCASLEPELGKSLNVEDTRIELSVSNLIYAGGDARKTIPAIAFTLPNDERVIEEVGARQVMLKNILEAKFRLVVWRILDRLLQTPPEDEDAASRSFFNHALFHEIAHAIGPHRITVNGEDTTVNRCLKQYHSILEEAKADTLGACLRLNFGNVSDSRTLLETYVGGFLRFVRFGLTRAHGRANAIQFNYLLRESAITIDSETGKLSIDQSRARKALFKLASNIIDIQERGDFDAAQSFVTAFGVMSPEIEELIHRISDLPIDIRIRYKEWA